MKTLTYRILLVSLLLLPAGSVAAADFSASLSYTSDYTVLGISRSRGGGAFQGGLNWQTRQGFYASLWASQVDYSVINSQVVSGGGYSIYRDERDLELDSYLGYLHTLSPNWRGEVMLAYYTYPGANTTWDWTYTETLFALHYQDRLSVALGISQNQFAKDGISRSLAVNGRLFNWQGLVASAGVGYVDSAALPDAWWYWNAGVARQFGSFRASISWHASGNNAQQFFGSARTEDRLELRLDVSF